MSKNACGGESGISAFCPRFRPCITDLTVEEYLEYCAELTAYPGSGDVKKAIEAVMDSMWYFAFCKSESIRNLSGGYQQRVGNCSGYYSQS